MTNGTDGSPPETAVLKRPRIVADRNEDDEARRLGRLALKEARRRFTAKVIEHLQQRDPELLARITEAGAPGDVPRIEVVRRVLEQSVERHPSVLASIGLSAIDAINTAADQEASGSTASLAVVFTDLEGFTEFTSREGDAAASQLLAEHHRRVQPIIRARGGRLVKRLGDGLMITFPEPAAALLASLELVDEQPQPLRMRAGVHRGQVVLTRDDVIGHVVNVTARIAEAAAGAEVLTTTALADELREELPRVQFGSRRDEAFKGIEEPVSICAASWL
jgi:adenylate cyclase